MRAVSIVILDVFSGQTPQLFLVHNDHVVKQIATQITHPTLRHAVLPWATPRRAFRFEAQRLGRFINCFAKNRIAIMEFRGQDTLFLWFCGWSFEFRGAGEQNLGA